MKQLIIAFLLTLSLSSCSLDDNENDFYTEFVPIESVDIPSEFVLGQVHTINLTYIRPSGCYVFNNFYYVSEANQRTVAIINTVYPNLECLPNENQEIEVSFNFIANHLETYVFRFWQGEDDNGNDIYYIVEVPVVE